MEKPDMRMMVARRAGWLLISAILAAGPACAQTSTSQDTNLPSTTPSGTAQKAVPRGANRLQGETMQTLVERRIADLHSRLQITPQESQQWDQFAQVMRDNAKEMDDLYRQRAEKLGSMSAVENMQSFEQIEEARAQQMQKLVPAFQALYASLSDQQKTEADRVFQYRAAHAEAHHHHHHETSQQ
jgi:periplasmic protein CpxP/Spy